jgi:hypothetical protein
MSDDTDTVPQGDGWREVEQEGARTSNGKEPLGGDDAEILEPTHSRRAFENDDKIRIVQK